MFGKRFLIYVVLLTILLLTSVACAQVKEDALMQSLSYTDSDCIMYIVDKISKMFEEMPLLTYKTSRMVCCLPSRREFSLEDSELIDKRNKQFNDDDFHINDSEQG